MHTHEIEDNSKALHFLSYSPDDKQLYDKLLMQKEKLCCTEIYQKAEESKSTLSKERAHLCIEKALEEMWLQVEEPKAIMDSAELAFERFK